MKNIKFIAIFAMLIGIATTAVFVGCEKKENPVVEQGIIKQQQNTLNKRHKEEEKKYYLQFCYTGAEGLNGIMCTGPMIGSTAPRCSVPHNCIALPDPRDQRPVQQEHIREQLLMVNEQLIMIDGGQPMTNENLLEIHEQLSVIYEQLSVIYIHLPISQEQKSMLREDLIAAYEGLEMIGEQQHPIPHEQLQMSYEQLFKVHNHLSIIHDKFSIIIDEHPEFYTTITSEEAQVLFKEIIEQYGGFLNTKPFIRQYWDLYQYLYEIGELVETPEELYEKADD